MAMTPRQPGETQGKIVVTGLTFDYSREELTTLIRSKITAMRQSAEFLRFGRMGLHSRYVTEKDAKAALNFDNKAEKLKFFLGKINPQDTYRLTREDLEALGLWE